MYQKEWAGVVLAIEARQDMDFEACSALGVRHCLGDMDNSEDMLDPVLERAGDSQEGNQVDNFDLAEAADNPVDILADSLGGRGLAGQAEVEHSRVDNRVGMSVERRE